MRSLSLLCAFVLLLLLSCAPERGGVAASGLPAAGTDQEIRLAAADTVLFEDGAARFWLTVQQIADNRCPLEVNCITGGKASAVLHLQFQPGVLEFCTGSDCREQNNSNLVEYNNERYTIVLEEISPYPAQGNERTPKQAIFKIKRATS